MCSSNRLALAVTCAVGFFLLYSSRSAFDSDRSCLFRNESLFLRSGKLPTGNGSDVTNNKKTNICEWTDSEHQMVVCSLYWGDVIAQIPAGWLAWKYGGKRVLCVCTLLSALVVLITSSALQQSVQLLIAFRFLLGLFQGAVWPCIQTLLANWAPQHEVSTLAGIAYAGWPAGIVVSSSVSFLWSPNQPGHLPIILYIQGTLILLWVVVFMTIVSESPSTHPGIVREEKNFIIHSQIERASYHQNEAASVWRSMMTCLPLWGILVSHVCGHWGRHVYTSTMSNIGTANINHLYVIIAHSGMFITLLLSGPIADRVCHQNYLSTTTTRKGFNSMGMFLPAAILLIVVFFPDTKSAVSVILLMVGFSMIGCMYSSGCIVNVIDTAPQYAGIVLSVSNTMASLPVIFLPSLTGEADISERGGNWQVTLVFTACVCVFGGLFYMVFGSGKIQIWRPSLVVEDSQVDSVHVGQGMPPTDKVVANVDTDGHFLSIDFIDDEQNDPALDEGGQTCV